MQASDQRPAYPSDPRLGQFAPPTPVPAPDTGVLPTAKTPGMALFIRAKRP